jgi:hypothetical protein
MLKPPFDMQIVVRNSFDILVFRQGSIHYAGVICW